MSAYYDYLADEARRYDEARERLERLRILDEHETRERARLLAERAS